jgi:RNA polymerase sigma factor (sigma-70 family)
MSDDYFWDEAIRKHGHQVYRALLRYRLAPEQAREITQEAWLRLIEQQKSGRLHVIDLPGLVIAQARYLALNSLERANCEDRMLATVSDPSTQPGIEQVVADREKIERVLAALETCPETARKVFGLVYGRPGGNAAGAAKELGLSVQRVRQILCELRAYLRRALEERSYDRAV